MSKKAVTISQEGQPFDEFTHEERIIKNNAGDFVAFQGSEVPWNTPFGACFMKIHAIRRQDGVIEFGLGNEEPEVLMWVPGKDIPRDWPD